MTTSNEFLLTALTQHSGMFVLAIDRNARITTVIGKSSCNVNFDAQAAIGQPVELYFANDPDRAKLIHDALNHHSPQSVTFRNENGHYFETQIVPLFDEQNEICGVLSFESNVTEREKQTIAHGEQEKKLEGLFQDTDDGIYLLDRNFVIQRANGAATVLHETEGEGEIAGQVCYQRVFGRDEPCEFCPVVKTFHTGQSAEASYFDEKFQKYLQLRSTPLFDPKTGILIGVFETFRDITDTVKLEYNKLQTQAIISGGNVPIAFGDADGKITFVNAAFQTLTGYSESELLGTRFWDTVYDERTKTDSHFLKIRTDLYARRVDRHRQDITIRRKDGAIRWVDFTASTVKDTKDKREQVIVILLDITDRYRIVQAFEEAHELAQIMLDTAPFGCDLIDQGGDILDCNTEAYKRLDVSSKQEYCERFFELSPEYQLNEQLTADAYKEKIAAIFEKGYLCFEWMHQKFDGTLVPCEVTAVRVKRGDEYIAVCYTHDLREREEMLAKIRKANEQSQIMLDATPIACTLVDRNGELIACNLATVRIFGLNDKQEYCERFWEFTPEYQPNGQLSKEMRHEKHAAAFDTGYQCYEWMFQKLDGTPLPCEVTLVRIRYEDDHVLAAYIRDLREHTEMLAKMRKKDEQARMMLDTNPQGCQIWDENFGIIDCNTAVVKMFGFKDKQEYIDRFFELLPAQTGPNSTEMALDYLKAALETGYQRFEVIQQLPDGTPFPCEVTLVRIPGDNGYMICGYTRDLREQKRDQQRMNALLELAQMTQHSEQEIIDYTIQSVASLTDSKMGYVVQLDHLKTNITFRSLLLDKSVSCQLPPVTEEGDGAHILSPALTECLQTKKTVIHGDLTTLPEMPMFSPERYPVNSHMNTPIMDGKTPVGIIGVGNKPDSYTEMDAKHLTLFAQGLGTLLNRRKYAEYLEKAKTEAEYASKAKSDFLARMSHEIRTPMNAVLGMAELALREDVSHVAYEQIATIKQSGQSLLSIINDILDFSKIESGKLEIASTDYLLASLINDIVSIIQMRVTDSNVRFAVNIDCNIPNNLVGDEVRIRQIMLNLLSNAVKYTDKGFVALDITGKKSDTDRDVVNLVLVVSDSGKGIKQENLDRLFDDFARFDMASNKNIEGTGLGLSIVHGLVNAMNGHVGVQSEYGKGSTFSVTLPQKIRKHEKLATVEHAENLRVLIYERRKIYADSVVRTLVNLGVECACVVTDAEFIEKISNENWSFLFIASSLYEQIKKPCSALVTNAKVVLFVGFGESAIDPNLNILPLPTHSISVANILNGGCGCFMYKESYASTVRFVAPEASILVVDDINTNLSIMEGLLKPYKMRVTLCKSGRDAIVAITARKYDLVFMDHMMPEMDGIETTAHIRSLNADDPYFTQVPIVALTANAISGVKQMFLKNGFNDFLSKPIDTVKLDTLLSAWIPGEKRNKFVIENDGPPPVREKEQNQKRTDKQGVVLNQEQPKRFGGIDWSALGKLVKTGMNLEKALQRMGGNRESLHNVLRSFVDNTPTLLESIKEVNKDNLANYAITVHGIKGACQGICADDVAGKALLLEKAAKSGDFEFVGVHHSEFLGSAFKLTAGIEAVLTQINANNRKPRRDKPNAEDLLKLSVACDNYDMDTVDAVMATIEEYEYVADDGLVNWLRQNVDQMNFAQIKEKTLALTKQT